MRKSIWVTILIVLILVISSCGNNEQKSTQVSTDIITTENSTIDTDSDIGTDLLSVSHISDNKYSSIYDGIKHDFLVYLPDTSEDNQENIPFVLMLHGYGDSAEGFCNKVHFEEKANARGYAVIYIDGAPDPNDQTAASGWNSGLKSDGNDDVGFLTAIAMYLEKEYSFDSSRAFVAGFSNGAFMTQRLAMEAPEGTFTGVVSVAGKMTASVYENRNEKNNISVFQVTGTKDEVIPQRQNGSDKFMNDPAIEDVIDYWASSNGLGVCEIEYVGKDSSLAKSYDNENPGNKVKVWHLQIKDGRHSWPEESITGVDINSTILDFFDEIS